mmetsp:Transcript_27600/g.82459  ORF Transcript_27600/g.82459 Transcript_27600/m.82459 type:complete len:845 (+) Transcript_27600:734-3268(+)
MNRVSAHDGLAAVDGPARVSAGRLLLVVFALHPVFRPPVGEGEEEVDVAVARHADGDRRLRRAHPHAVVAVLARRHGLLRDGYTALQREQRLRDGVRQRVRRVGRLAEHADDERALAAQVRVVRRDVDRVAPLALRRPRVAQRVGVVAHAHKEVRVAKVGRDGDGDVVGAGRREELVVPPLRVARHAVLRLAVHQQRHAARRRRELHKDAGVVVQVPLEEVAGRLGHEDGRHLDEGGVVAADGAHEDEAPFDVVRHHHADRARVLHALDLVCEVGVRQRAGGVVARPALDKHNLAGEGGGVGELRAGVLRLRLHERPRERRAGQRRPEVCRVRVVVALDGGGEGDVEGGRDGVGRGEQREGGDGLVVLAVDADVEDARVLLELAAREELVAVVDQEDVRSGVLRRPLEVATSRARVGAIDGRVDVWVAREDGEDDLDVDRLLREVELEVLVRAGRHLLPRRRAVLEHGDRLVGARDEGVRARRLARDRDVDLAVGAELRVVVPYLDAEIGPGVRRPAVLLRLRASLLADPRVQPCGARGHVGDDGQVGVRARDVSHVVARAAGGQLAGLPPSLHQLDRSVSGPRNHREGGGGMVRLDGEVVGAARAAAAAPVARRDGEVLVPMLRLPLLFGGRPRGVRLVGPDRCVLAARREVKVGVARQRRHGEVEGLVVRGGGEADGEVAVLVSASLVPARDGGTARLVARLERDDGRGGREEHRVLGRVGRLDDDGDQRLGRHHRHDHHVVAGRALDEVVVGEGKALLCGGARAHVQVRVAKGRRDGDGDAPVGLCARARVAVEEGRGVALHGAGVHRCVERHLLGDSRDVELGLVELVGAHGLELVSEVL